MAIYGEAMSTGLGFTPSAGPATSRGGVGRAIQQAGELFMKGLSGIEEGQKAKAQAQQNDMKTSFIRKQEAIVSGFNQGRYSASTMNTRLNASYDEIIGTNPQLIDMYTEAHEGVMDRHGLTGATGKRVSAEIKLENEAIAAGDIDTTSTSPKAKEEGTRAYVKRKRAQQDLEDANDLVSYARNTIGLSDAERNQAKEEAKVKGEQALGTLHDVEFRSWRILNNSVAQQVRAGQLTYEEGVKQLQDKKAEIDNTFTSIGESAGTERYTAYQQQYENTFNANLKYMSGEMSLGEWNRTIERNVAMQKLNLANDPEVATYMALGQMLPNADLSTFTAVNTKVIGILAAMKKAGVSEEGQPKSAPPNLTDPENEEATKGYLKVVDNLLEKAEKGGLPEEGREELNSNLTGILSTMDVHKAYIEEPKQVAPLMNTIASPSWGKYVIEQGGIPKSAAEGVMEVYEVYEKNGRTLIDEAYKTSGINLSTGLFSDKKTTITQYIVPQYQEGGGFSFTIPEGAMRGLNYMARGKVEAELRHLNRTVTPAVNKLVMARSHLEFNTDYRTTYENSILPIFTGEAPVQSTGTPQQAGAAPKAEAPKAEAKTATPVAAPNQLIQYTNPVTGGSLSVGDVVDGWEYMGGDPHDQNSWNTGGGGNDA